MAQPKIPGTAIGKPVMPYGSDGSDWIALLVSGVGALQVELASLPTGAVTIADGADVTLGALADALVAAGATGSVSAKLRRLTTDLDALLTELKLKADLTETQPISAASLPLPSSAATEATLDAIKTAVEIIDGFADAQNIIFGFSEQYAYTRIDPDLPALDSDYWSGLVPSGEVWVITSVCLIYTGTPPEYIQLQHRVATVTYIVARKLAPVSDDPLHWTGKLYVVEGDRIGMHVENPTAGDVFRGDFLGYKMKV